MMDNVVMLMARTARSQAYAQAMRHREIRVGTVILYGDSKPRAGQVTSPIEKKLSAKIGLNFPDLSIPLEETLTGVADKMLSLPIGDVNSFEVIEALKELQPQLIVYSGFGSQLVGEKLLNLKSPFLHVHAGLLPLFRGSTTIYYELLEHGRCSASALLLSNRIDEGPVLATKSYPPPSQGVDIDYLYDPTIRADLLCDILDHLKRLGTLPKAIPQKPTGAQTYYVIHPILKHLAILANQQVKS